MRWQKYLLKLVGQKHPQNPGDEGIAVVKSLGGTDHSCGLSLSYPEITHIFVCHWPAVNVKLNRTQAFPPKANKRARDNILLAKSPIPLLRGMPLEV